MRKLIFLMLINLVALTALTGCSKTAATKTNFQKALSTYYSGNAHNPTCDTIIIGRDFGPLTNRAIANYQTLQTAGYLQFSKKEIAQSIFGNAYRYTASLTPQGQAWMTLKPLKNSSFAHNTAALQQADYCLGTMKITDIRSYSELKEDEKWHDEKIAEVFFDYQIEDIPANLKDTLGQSFQKTLHGKATFQVKDERWQVEHVSLNRND